MKFWPSQPRQPLVGLAIAAMLGIVVADRVEMPAPWAFLFPALAVILVLLRPATVSCWVLCAALFFELHIIRDGNSDARWLAGILAKGPRVVEAAGIVWSEPEKPQTFSRTITSRFVLKLESLDFTPSSEKRGGEKLFKTDALINVSWDGTVPVYGDRVTLRGGALNLEPSRNPGEFDSVGYQQRRGIYSEIRARYAADCQIEAHHHGNPLMAFGLAARHWVQGRLELDLADSPELTAVIDGIVLGLRGESPEDLKLLLQRTGTIHLFVVSGLNIAMLSSIALLLFRACGLPRRLIYVLVIAVLWTYVLVTGLRTASVRAAIMATLFLGTAIVDRRALTLNNLAAAALVVLLLEDNELFAPGFQFSFAVVFVVIVCAGPLQRRLERVAQPDPFLPRDLWTWPLKCGVWIWHWFCGVLGVMVASWVGSLAFTAGYFHLFSPGSLLANFLAVPVAFIILALGLGSILTARISSHLVVLFNNANWFAAKAMLFVLHGAGSLPGSFIYVSRPPLAAPPKCEIQVLDLGDGGSVHVRAAGRDWLLDCGDDFHYTRTVLPYLRTRGVNRLDGLLLTHGNVHNLGAASTALTDFQPRFIAESMLHDRSPNRKKFHEALMADRRGKGLYTRGDLIHLGNAATLRVLFPPIGLKRTSAADMALVLQLQCGRTRALFMSDSGFSTEQWLLENEPDLKSDLVIKGQHTKDLSGTPEFLARVAPKIVVCSSLGYGEPVEKLDTWEKDTAAQGIAVFRQDHTGAVRIDIRDDGYEVQSFLNGQIFRNRAR